MTLWSKCLKLTRQIIIQTFFRDVRPLWKVNLASQIFADDLSPKSKTANVRIQKNSIKGFDFTLFCLGEEQTINHLGRLFLGGETPRGSIWIGTCMTGFNEEKSFQAWNSRTAITVMIRSMFGADMLISRGQFRPQTEYLLNFVHKELGNLEGDKESLCQF